MKKLIVSLIFISSVVFGQNLICDISGYKAIETVDNFGNKNTEYIPKLKATLLEWMKKRDYENLEKFFAENIYLNINGYHGFDSLLNDKIERATFFSGTLRGVLSGAVSSGQFPSSIEINTLNIATVKNKVKVNADIYNIAGAFVNYFLSSKNINTMRDRTLLMIAFLLQKDAILIPFECKRDIYSNFAEMLLSDYMLTGFVKLLQKKDRDALHLAFLMLQHKYNDVDKFLLNKKEVKKLFLIGKQYYLKVAKTYKVCERADRFNVGYICFPKGKKEEAIKFLNKVEKLSSKKIKLMGKGDMGADDGNVGTFLSSRYCKMKKGQVIPKVFYMKSAPDKYKYCIFIYEGIKTREKLKQTKKHNLKSKVVNTHKTCKEVSTADDFKVGYVCFPKKVEALKELNKLKELSTKDIKKHLMGYVYMYKYSGTIGTFLSSKYCKLKTGEIIPKVFYMNGAPDKYKYCIFTYEGIRRIRN